MNAAADLLSVIIRTMPDRFQFLDQCLLSLAGQSYRPLEIAIVCQIRDRPISAQLEAIVARYRWAFSNTNIIEHGGGTDARAKALNLGLARARGRFLAFLDDDDVVYPSHYVKLIGVLSRSQRAWAYSDVVCAYYTRDDQGRRYLTRRAMPFKRPGYSFVSHLRANFIPLHSFVLDRDKIGTVPPFFEELSRLEDYDFLLRIAALHQPYYLPEPTCEYRVWTDGSNSIISGAADPLRGQKRALWDSAERVVWERKRALVGWWLEDMIAASAGDADLDRYWNSLSWRVTRPLRNLVRRFRGQAPERRPIVQSSIEAARIVEEIRESISWEVTGPLRAMRRMWEHREHVKVFIRGMLHGRSQ